jgi:hypothetical protein
VEPDASGRRGARVGKIRMVEAGILDGGVRRHGDGGDARAAQGRNDNPALRSIQAEVNRKSAAGKRRGRPSKNRGAHHMHG